MYLKKIEISGFKSFANKTVLNLEKGITAIVGPNGSGKSNIADAIKWVLGEQSVKSLRGKKSEDVIFAGSEKKAQVSAASVFLAFDNGDKKIPLDFEEISFGRKIFRDGTGEYLLNGKKARLLDIAEVLAASGTGKGDYSIVNQGMTDKILASTPIERRLMLEEASGIKQFRLKRDQAERKLEGTNQNICRISDLLSELEPRLKFLRKQSVKAEKRGEVENQLKEIQIKYYSSKLSLLKKEKSDFDSHLKDFAEKIEKSKLELLKLEEDMKKESEKESSGQEQTAEIRKNLQELSFKRREMEKEEAILEGRIDLLKGQILDKQNKISSLFKEKEKNSQAESKKREINKDDKILVGRKDLEDLLNFSESADKESAEQLKAVLDKISAFFRRLVGTKEKPEAEIPKNDLSWIDNQIKSLEEEIKTNSKGIENLKIELLEKNQKLQEVENKISQMDSEIIRISQEDQKRRSGFFALEREARLKRDDLDELRSRENGVKIEASRVLVHLEDLEKEIRDEIGSDFSAVSEICGKEDLLRFESETRRLKALLEQIGGIDSLTLEEHKETEKRFSDMSREFEDLEKAKKNLNELILDLDKQMERRFAESFGIIADEFEKYFKMIFGGGSAKIFYSKVKEGADEADESEGEEKKSSDNFGIEIEAVPPGKKTKNLSMLSGGERALSSIALLFAIIASSHPPFCVLDEVDAALDEANSSKIGQVFKELSKKTQFIVITHNREIMNQSSALYGITMQKDGVSQLLSVKLCSKSQNPKTPKTN